MVGAGTLRVMDGSPLVDLGDVGVLVLLEEATTVDRLAALLMRRGISGDALERSSGVGLGSGSRLGTAGAVTFDAAAEALALVDVYGVGDSRRRDGCLVRLGLVDELGAGSDDTLPDVSSSTAGAGTGAAGWVVAFAGLFFPSAFLANFPFISRFGLRTGVPGGR